MESLARRVRRGALAAGGLLGLACLGGAAGAEEPVFSPLAGYTFEESRLDTGPDTFRVFEDRRGAVTLTRQFRWSGDSAVEIRDVAGNGDFPELMGFFDRRTSGQVFVHFALLVTDPDEELNVALVGEQGFRLEKDGFALWIKTSGGRLLHVSDSIPKPLGRLEAFTWYQFDVLYDVERGRYSIAVTEEGAGEPLASLTDQPNAANQPGSAVERFSFVSDPFEDRSGVVYYVDDIVIGADEELEPPRLAAPGRRRLFVESALDAAVAAAQEGSDEWLEAMAERRYEAAYAIAQAQLSDGATAIWLERAGDAALLDGSPGLALEQYDRLVGLAGDSPALMLKRADASYLLGDLDEEKRLRELIFGTLDPLPEAPAEP